MIEGHQKSVANVDAGTVCVRAPELLLLGLLLPLELGLRGRTVPAGEDGW